MEEKTFNSLDIGFEPTLSITMQKKFYSSFGGIIKLNSRYEYIKETNRPRLIIEQEYWDTTLRKVYPVKIIMTQLIRLMDNSIKSGENLLLIIIEMQEEMNKKKGNKLRRLIRQIFKKK